MSGQNQQILALFKQGLSAAEIAEGLGYDVETVEFVLKNDKEMVREIQKFSAEAASRLDETFADLEPLAVATMKELLQNAEKESVQFAAAQYVMDQRLGLKKPARQTVVLNVVDINERFQRMKERRRQLQEGAIDIDAATKTIAA